jgi:hypothetical protein
MLAKGLVDEEELLSGLCHVLDRFAKEKTAAA